MGAVVELVSGVGVSVGVKSKEKEEKVRGGINMNRRLYPLVLMQHVLG